MVAATPSVCVLVRSCPGLWGIRAEVWLLAGERAGHRVGPPCDLHVHRPATKLPREFPTALDMNERARKPKASRLPTESIDAPEGCRPTADPARQRLRSRLSCREDFETQPRVPVDVPAPGTSSDRSYGTLGETCPSWPSSCPVGVFYRKGENFSAQAWQGPSDATNS